MSATRRDPHDLDFVTGLLYSTQTLESLLDGLLRLATTEIDADGATITMAKDRHFETSVSTADKYREIDLIQYRQGMGPCLQAIETRKTVVADYRDDKRWGPLAQEARRRGVVRALASPLIAGGETVGSINMYSTSEDAFDEIPDDLLRLITEVTAIFLRNYQLFDQRGELIQQLYQALESRSVIDMAKGKLMERHGIDAEDAFSRLRETSQHSNVKLRDVARGIVEGGPSES